MVTLLHFPLHPQPDQRDDRPEARSPGALGDPVRRGRDGRLRDPAPRQLESERELETRNLVDLAHAIVAHHHSLAQQGVLPEEAAKTAALGAVEQLRYGERGYFWISDRKSAFLMHPFEPELVGNESASSLRDCKALLDRFAEAVRRDGQGFVSYRWPKPGTKEPVRKLSFVREFTPWGSIIGTGVFVDDIDARFYSQAGWFLASLLLIAAVFILVAWRIARSILDPLGGEPAFVAESRTASRTASSRSHSRPARAMARRC